MFQFFQVSKLAEYVLKLLYWRSNYMYNFMWWEDCRHVWMHNTTLNTALCATVGVAIFRWFIPVVCAVIRIIMLWSDESQTQQNLLWCYESDKHVIHLTHNTIINSVVFDLHHFISLLFVWVGVAFPQHLTPVKITVLANSACIILSLPYIMLPRTVQLWPACLESTKCAL